MKLLITRKLPDEVEEAFAAAFDVTLNPTDALLDEEALVAAAEGHDAIVPCHTESFSRGVFQRLPDSVRLIANFSVGYDHVDVGAAKEKGVVVTNTPDVLSDATAEIAMLCLLGAARRAGEGEALVRQAAWKDWSPSFMVGHQVTGQAIGIVGMGRVGQVFAKRARGFDMDVHYYNRARLPEALEFGATYHDTLDSLLAVSRFVSLHCPSTEETRGLMDRERLAMLPAGAILVNTARGALIDDDALIHALSSGHIAAAGLDVYNNEPHIDPRYRDLSNTFLLPHVGSATRETRIAMGMRALENVKAFAAGEAPGDRVA